MTSAPIDLAKAMKDRARERIARTPTGCVAVFMKAEPSEQEKADENALLRSIQDRLTLEVQRAYALLDNDERTKTIIDMVHSNVRLQRGLG